MTQHDVEKQLEKVRLEQLDLTARNRLLNTSRSRAASSRLEIVDELSSEVFRILYREKNDMSFLPSKKKEANSAIGDECEDSNDSSYLLLQPDEDELGEGLAERHVDDKLQTTIEPEKLQTKLLRMFYEARTYEEEQGSNIIYLALGFLKWYEDPKSDKARYAPLILLPVRLERKSANAKFKLSAIDEEITTNLSLQEKLRLDFEFALPDIADGETLVPDEYFAEVRESISSEPRWEVIDNDIVLWFYSFSRFLMYRDLQPESWPPGCSIEKRGLVGSLLGSGFGAEPAIFGGSEDVDEILNPEDAFHVVDADSSQTLVIEEAKANTNLVVQGPPGTGKSQTITNMIASSVKAGKRVLFVAEKMAALSVVKRNMDKIGLGDMCLELHSHKANKRNLLKDLHRTLNLPAPVGDGSPVQAEQLKSNRDRLNEHSAMMHAEIHSTGMTPFRVIGELVRLCADDVGATDFDLPEALSWSATDFASKRRLLEDLVSHLKVVDDPAKHPFRGVGLELALPADVQRMTHSFRKLEAELSVLDDATEKLSEIFRDEDDASLTGTHRLGMMAQSVLQMPALDRDALATPAWDPAHRMDIMALIEAAKTAAECAAKLQDVVVEDAWTEDVRSIRKDLASHGKSWFRFLVPRYHRAKAAFRGLMQDAALRPTREALNILDTVLKGQKALKTLQRDQSGVNLAARAFGCDWKGESSDFQALAKILEWRESIDKTNFGNRFFEAVTELADPALLKPAFRIIVKRLQKATNGLKKLQADLQLDTSVAFGTTRLNRVARSELTARLNQWQQNANSISEWIAYNRRCQRARVEGLTELAQAIHTGKTKTSDVITQFESAYYETLIRAAYLQYPNLADFEGISHGAIQARFRQLDQERIEIARSEVAIAHHAGLPQGSRSPEMGVLRHEMKKKTRHKPIRKLIAEAGSEIQAIKPVFMMSPMSVAQYLPPATVEFDLLLIDEASQVRPSDAIGAIARAKQIVVVGDDKQLPPTDFFRKSTDDGDGDNAADLESILGLCEAKNMPARMLQWHYRSRHQSLIAVSNREFYDSRLFIVPSPFSESENLGLKYRFVDGAYDRGGSATNPIEAKAVATAVMEHARHAPLKSLGVAAFSVKQRDAILDELERLRRACPDYESFFVNEGAEPFFVKNLENVQGDQRDVIFISVGYGKDADGYTSMSFGPLNRDGGERRMNVLISRAKDRCEVFTNLSADDIDLARSNARGVTSLKTFLAFAEKGILGVPENHDGDFDSEFERQVHAAIKRHGYEVHCQVGMAGFRIDLAVVDPECPGRYLLGVECDGATYHSSRSARDRDRIRQQVLEDRGWEIHRIWSTDWFKNPEAQIRKTIEAIEEAKVSQVMNAESQPTEIPITPSTSVKRSAPKTVDGITTYAYEEADFPVDTDIAIPKMSISDLASIIAMVVNIEGPIHQEQVHQRVRGLWGLTRRGKRIDEAINDALDAAESNGQIHQHGSFFSPADLKSLQVRDREKVWTSELRKAKYLPPSEIRAAIIVVLSNKGPQSIDELVRWISRLLGLMTVTQQFTALMNEELSDMRRESLVSVTNTNVCLASVGKALETATSTWLIE